MIDEKLLLLDQNIKDAYGALEAKGAIMPEARGTSQLVNTINSISGGGEEEEWQPDADMVWAKSVCENDIDDFSTHKVLQMVDDKWDNNSIYVPSGCIVKTSDGQRYSSGTWIHYWDDTNAHQSEVYNDVKLRWLIYYYSDGKTVISNEILLNTKYICFSNILVTNVFGSKYLLEYFDMINNARLYTSNTSYINYTNLFGQCYSLKAVKNLSLLNIEVAWSLFQNCYNLEYVSIIDAGSLTDVSDMFASCRKLKTIYIDDLSSIKNMDRVFYECSMLSNLYLPDISSCISITRAFYNTGLKELSLSIPNITSLEGTFANSKLLRKITLTDTGKVISMNSTFSNCQSLSEVHLDDVRNIENCADAFAQCAFSYFDISNMTSLKNANYMFYRCYNLKAVNCGAMPDLESANGMFSEASSLEKVEINSTINLSTMNQICSGCQSLRSFIMPNTNNVSGNYNILYNCTNLYTVYLDMYNSPPNSNMFGNNRSLKELHLTNIRTSTNISVATTFDRNILVEILNNLADLTNETSQRLTMGYNNLNKLTAADKAIATNKNWTLA